MAGLAFVDDTDLVVNGISKSAAKLETKMQQSLTMWHGLLWATSRQLVPEKWFWYLINFEWNNKHWKYKKAKDTQGQLSVQQPQAGKIIIF